MEHWYEKLMFVFFVIMYIATDDLAYLIVANIFISMAVYHSVNSRK